LWKNADCDEESDMMAKSFDQMSAAELAKATSEYDEPWSGRGLPGKPLTAAQRTVHRRAAAKASPGRPMIGKGAKIVPVSIERGLLKETDAFARRHKLKRSQMVAKGLRLLMQEWAKAS
jgi:hypothetical protein